MATPNVGILTNAGKNLIDQVNAGQTKITFSKIVFSSMNNNQLTDDQIKALTTVAPQEIVVNNPEVTLDNNTGETRIRATGNNEALTDGVYVKTYAVFAKDDSGNEILYGLTVSPNPNYLPEYDGVTPQAVTYSYKVNISNTSNITFTNSNDVYVSDTDLAEALQPYAKTVDVNQQLDKKVTDNKDGSIVVNGKTFVPADDSKVVHDNHDGTIQVNGNSILPSNDSVVGRIDGTYTDMNDVPKGWWYLNGWSASPTSISNWGLPQSLYYVHCFTIDPWHTIQAAYDVNSNNVYVRTGVNSTWTSWKLAADDSKVAHLSGANNFDTVPTVNNNPLLLASSLPSDYVKDNFDGTITANGTIFNLLKSLSATSIPQDPTKDYNTLPQGLALMSETNGEPANMPPVKSTYLTLTIASNFSTGRKRQLAWLDAGANSSNNNYTYIRYCVGSTWSSWDSIPTSTQITSLIPSTIADTTKLANFTAGLQSGGVSVATSDDLKSVENSAWHQLSMPDCNGMGEITLLYRNFISDHYMNLYAYGIGIQSNIQGPTMLDLSSLIDKIESVSGVATGPTFTYVSPNTGYAQLAASGNKLKLGSDVSMEVNLRPVLISGNGSPFAKVNYDNWIGS